jgi:hypothetical protein
VRISTSPRSPGGRPGPGPGAFDPIGIFLHHTGGATVGEEPSLQTVINGRPDLRGPLAQFHVARSGRLNLISAGRANHAEKGSPKVLDEVRRGVLITRTAAERNLPDDKDNVGNRWFWGFEVQGPPFTDAQVETCVRGCVALFRGHGWPIEDLYRIVTHAIWTKRKHDPDFDPVAANVRARVRGREGDWFEMATEADLERVIRRLLEFGPGFGDASYGGLINGLVIRVMSSDQHKETIRRQMLESLNSDEGRRIIAEIVREATSTS